MGSDIAIRTGEAFDVKVQPVLVERRRMSEHRWRTTMRYTLTNANPEPVSVDLIQAGLWGDTRIVDESQESSRRSRSEEHTSELQSLMRSSYAVFCLNKK